MLNPVLKKEFQLLKGPIWASMILLALVCIIAKFGNPQYMPSPTWLLAPFGLLLCYLITAAFGHELGEHSLAAWMMQPKSRSELWKLKLKGLVSVYAGACLLFGFTILLIPRNEVYGWTNVVTTLPFWLIWLPLMCFGPGIYFTLKFRNPTASFWLTGAIPVIFIPVVWFVLDLINSILRMSISNPIALGILLFLSLAYASWGFWAARRQFVHWEDLGLESKTIEFEFGKAKASKDRTRGVETKRRSKWAMLFLRELRLQQINILAGVVLLIGIWSTHYWHQSLVKGGRFGHEVELIGLLPTVLRYLLFILPCSIAAMSFADIRRQDTHTWELLLPVSRRMQFIFKAFTCVALGWIITAGLPFTFDKNVSYVSTFESIFKGMALCIITIATLVISATSIYISSLTSSFLKSFSFSLGTAPIMIFFTGFIYTLANGKEMDSVIGFFAVPTLVLLIVSVFTLWWSKSNFSAPVILKQQKSQNWKRWGWCIGIILLWLGIMVDRSWERILLIEPRAKAPLTLTIDTTSEDFDDWSKEHLVVNYKEDEPNQSRIMIRPNLGGPLYVAGMALTGDGKLFLVESGKIRWFHTRKKNIPTTKRVVLDFASGNEDSILPARASEMTAFWSHRFMLDLSGGLWMWNQSDEERFFSEEAPHDHTMIIPKQLAKGERFRNLCARSTSVFALDTKDFLWSAKQIKEGNSYTSELGEFTKVFPEHQWKEIASAPTGMLGLKQDGTLWGWGRGWNGLLHSELTMDEDKKNDIPFHIFKEKKWKTIYPQNEQFMAMDEAGAIWVPTHSFFFHPNNVKIPNLAKRILCKVELPEMRQYVTYEAHRFVDRTPFYWIKEDGTLWRSEFVLENLQDNTDQDIIARPTKSKQIGRRNDWVALTFSAGMTADGKIWNWDRPRHYKTWNPFPARFRHKVVAELVP